MKIIYDFGANKGDELGYYLKKADRVIAVEANPVLCAQIRTRYAEEIGSGRLIVEEKVLVTEGHPSEVFFYIHKTDHVRSQFPEPNILADFDKVLLPSCSPLTLIGRYGEPHYIKIDIEYSDVPILRELFFSGVCPPFISAEAHTVEVFACLVALGRYQAFKLVDGPTVASVYGKAIIRGQDGLETYSFPFHSAGPFGDDVKGPWFSATDFMKVLAVEGLGWKDIHASNIRYENVVPVGKAALAFRLARREARKFKRGLGF